ncbi:hypothetical protein B9Z55_013768 [Caenorhabditis nigoni]|nr:hypothetical protein B9Z55_013768 [Caenorhabditis nigoni]
MEISKQLEKFQTKWLNYQNSQTQCDCNLDENINREKYRKKRKLILKSLKEESTVTCPFKSCGDIDNSYNFEEEKEEEEFEIFCSQTWPL